MDRRKARDKAFLLIYQYKFQPNDIEDLLTDFLNENDAGENREYISSTVLGVVEKAEEIDKALSEFLKDWQIDRVSSVCLAALRLGAYEIMYNDGVPSAVAVNEAVNIAKRYEGEEAVSFVNGILGNIKDRY